MRYIIAYRLRRKNARRKMYSKFEAENVSEAIKQFDSYIQYRKQTEDTSKQLWELLTGDWQHVCFWCEGCKKKHHRNVQHMRQLRNDERDRKKE